VKYLQRLWIDVKGNSCYILQYILDVLSYIAKLFLVVHFFSFMTWHSTLSVSMCFPVTLLLVFITFLWGSE